MIMMCVDIKRTDNGTRNLDVNEFHESWRVCCGVDEASMVDRGRP